MLGYEDLLESVQESRDRLGVEQIDCLYVHWPRDAYDPAETLSALDTLFRRGSIEGVGLSNFTPDLLNEALTRLNAPVLAHQVEMHPLLPQSELLGYAREHDHVLVAYSPLARGEVLDAPQVEAVAKAHGATSAQVVLAWCRAKRAVPIPKATGDHILENYQGLEITLSESDVASIDSIDKTKRLVNPPSAPWE
jgi:2,5-diketo-D-gluconate reductase B